MKTKCNITGIEFDATSASQKNHTEVSKLMTHLHKHDFNKYHDAKNALCEMKGKFNNITEVLIFVKEMKTPITESSFPEDHNTDAQY